MISELLRIIEVILYIQFITSLFVCISFMRIILFYLHII